jgi:hypothetical protein
MQALIINTNKYNLVILFFFLLRVYLLSQQADANLQYQQ